MMSKAISVSGRTAITLAMLVTLVGWTSHPAQARVFIGLGIPLYGPGYYYPPPVYYPPPPVYYAPPPPAYYPPPGYEPPPGYAPSQTYAPPPAAIAPAGSGAGQACYAGAYVCPMDRPVASGGNCYCPGNGGQRVLGHAS